MSDKTNEVKEIEKEVERVSLLLEDMMRVRILNRRWKDEGRVGWVEAGPFKRNNLLWKSKE